MKKNKKRQVATFLLATTIAFANVALCDASSGKSCNVTDARTGVCVPSTIIIKKGRELTLKTELKSRVKVAEKGIVSATVSGKKIVLTADEKGQTAVTISQKGTKSKTIMVKVAQPSVMKLASNKVTVVAGKTKKVKIEKFTPSVAKQIKCKVKSANKKIASASVKSGFVRITGQKKGTTKVFVYSSDLSSVKMLKVCVKAQSATDKNAKSNQSESEDSKSTDDKNNSKEEAANKNSSTTKKLSTTKKTATTKKTSTTKKPATTKKTPTTQKPATTQAPQLKIKRVKQENGVFTLPCSYNSISMLMVYSDRLLGSGSGVGICDEGLQNMINALQNNTAAQDFATKQVGDQVDLFVETAQVKAKNADGSAVVVCRGKEFTLNITGTEMKINNTTILFDIANQKLQISSSDASEKEDLDSIELEVTYLE